MHDNHEQRAGPGCEDPLTDNGCQKDLNNNNILKCMDCEAYDQSQKQMKTKYHFNPTINNSQMNAKLGGPNKLVLVQFAVAQKEKEGEEE